MADNARRPTHNTADGSRDDAKGWLAFLGNRLLLALLAVSLIPMGFLGVTTYRMASTALQAQAFAKLETVNTVTAKSVERYFETLHQELRVLSEDKMVAQALERFRDGFATVAAENGLDEKTMPRARRDLQAFYGGEFAAEYRRRSGQDIDDTKLLVDALDDAAVCLQNLYIVGNEHPIGSKQQLDAADDDSAYTKAHAEYHPVFRSTEYTECQFNRLC